jgi:hypothetical protein
MANELPVSAGWHCVHSSTRFDALCHHSFNRVLPPDFCCLCSKVVFVLRIPGFHASSPRLTKLANKVVFHSDRSTSSPLLRVQSAVGSRLHRYRFPRTSCLFCDWRGGRPSPTRRRVGSSDQRQCQSPCASTARCTRLIVSVSLSLDLSLVHLTCRCLDRLFWASISAFILRPKHTTHRSSGSAS